MSKLKKSDVKHVAKLSRLKLSKEEIIKFQKQLSDIISYIDVLNEVDTSDLEPTSQTTGLENVVRKDEVLPEDCLSQDKALSGTDETENGYFKVPMILEERTV